MRNGRVPRTGELWAAAGLADGARVADVGCGPGAMLVALADVVGPTGHVVGIDGDPEAVVAARSALAAARATVPRIATGEVHEGRADSTGLPPESVDTAVLRHVLAHNGGAEQRIVDHLATLVRPGGLSGNARPCCDPGGPSLPGATAHSDGIAGDTGQGGRPGRGP